MKKLLRASGLVCSLLFTACSPEPQGRERTSLPTRQPSASFYPISLAGRELPTSQLIYVPIYSHIALPGAEARTLELSATLSIRNTDPSQRIVLLSVAYYDTSGALVQEYLAESFALAPMASTEVVVAQQDRRGGAGANFVVQWGAEAAVSAPLVEAVMAGTMGNYSFAFARPGRVIQRPSSLPASPG